MRSPMKMLLILKLLASKAQGNIYGGHQLGIMARTLLPSNVKETKASSNVLKHFNTFTQIPQTY
jgi:hypothetical protein